MNGIHNNRNKRRRDNTSVDRQDPPKKKRKITREEQQSKTNHICESLKLLDPNTITYQNEQCIKDFKTLVKEKKYLIDRTKFVNQAHDLYKRRFTLTMENLGNFSVGNAKFTKRTTQTKQRLSQSLLDSSARSFIRDHPNAGDVIRAYLAHLENSKSTKNTEKLYKTQKKKGGKDNNSNTRA